MNEFCTHLDGHKLFVQSIHMFIGLYQLKVDMGMLNTVKIYWDAFRAYSPSSEQKGVRSDEGLTLETSAQ